MSFIVLAGDRCAGAGTCEGTSREDDDAVAQPAQPICARDVWCAAPPECLSRDSTATPAVVLAEYAGGSCSRAVSHLHSLTLHLL